MSRVLVLGANGFIGSHLVDSLSSEGHLVRAFGHFDSKNVRFDERENVEIVRGEFLNKADIVEALRDIDYVFHFLSMTTPSSTDDDPLVDIETNIRMSVELFQACVDAGVKRIIYASSGGAIYGPGSYGKVNRHKEDDTPHPVSPYAIGKLTLEHYLHYFRVKKGLSSYVFRISNPYGERQPLYRKQGVIPIFVENIYSGKPIGVMGDGAATRDYIYVKDLAGIISKVFDKDLKHTTYNIGSGVSTSLSEVIETAEKIIGKQATIHHIDTPLTYVEHVSIDVSRLEAEVGKFAQTPLHEGMRRTYSYIKDQLERAATPDIL